MAAPTRSSNGTAERNGRAWASLLAGCLAVAVVPAAVGLAELSDAVELLDATASLPVALVLGIAAVRLARAARRRTEWTIGRVGGLGPARAGRLLGLVGMCLAIAGGIAVATYYALARWAE